MSSTQTLSEQQKEIIGRLGELWEQKKSATGISQEQAAAHLDWSTSTFNHYLRGIMKPNTDAVLKFAQFFEVSPAEIDPSLDIWGTELAGPVQSNLDQLKVYVGGLGASDLIELINLCLQRLANNK